MDIKEYERFLNEYSKYVLFQIETHYSKFFNDEKKRILEYYKNNDFVVVESPEIYKNKRPDAKRAPIAHSTKSFNDNLIHFYPEEYIEYFTKNEVDIFELSKGILVHEIFHIFVQPVSTDLNTDLKLAIEEGMVDFMTRDLCDKCNIDYSSNYEKHSSFVSDLLGEISLNEDEKLLNAFYIKEEQLIIKLKECGIDINDVFDEYKITKGNHK